MSSADSALPTATVSHSSSGFKSNEPSSSRPRESATLFRLGALLAAVLSLFVYRHTLSHGFVMLDDDMNLVLNPHLGTLTPDRLRWMFTDLAYSRRYIPLGWLCFCAVYSFFGLNPLGYHLALVGFHVANSVLFFVVIERVVRLLGAQDASAADRTWRTICALLASLWWSLNPLRVESVAWASGLFYGEAVFFAFASLAVFLGYLLDRRSGSKQTRESTAHAPALYLALYGASILSYPIAIGLAPIYLVVEWAVARRDGTRIGWLRGCAALAMAGAVLGISLFASVRASVQWTDAAGLPTTPAVAKAGRAAYAFSYYLAKPWVPVGLSDAYSTTEYRPETRGPGGPRSFWNFRLVSGIAGTLILAALVAGSGAFRRIAGPFLFCYLAVVIPFLGLSEQSYSTVDRYSTFACGLLAAALAIVLLRLSGRMRAIAAVGLCAYLAILARMSEIQSLIWRNSDSYFAYSSSVLAPGEFPLFKYYRPANFLIWSGRYDEAASVVAQGLRVLPNDLRILSLERDIRNDRTTYARFSQFSEVHVDDAIRFMGSGEWREADEHLRMALEQSPGYFEAAQYRSYVRTKLGDSRGALHELLRAEAYTRSRMPASMRRRFLDAIAQESDGGTMRL